MKDRVIVHTRGVASLSMNAEKMGLSNRAAIFRLIRSQPNICRKALSEKTGLDPSTITKIISNFIQSGFVKESGVNRSDSPGRSSIRLSVVKEAAISFLVSIGVEKTHLSLGFLDHSFQPIEEFYTPAEFESFLGVITEKIQRFYQQYPKKEAIFGISLSVPGMVDRRNRSFINVPHLRWQNIPFFERFQKKLPDIPLEIFLANEAQLSLMAERFINTELNSFQDGVYLFLSQGIGGSLLLDGDIYLGNSFSAGEIGHMSIVSDGIACHCGNRGCLETVASIVPIVDAYQQAGRILEGNDYYEKFLKLIFLYKENQPLARKVMNLMLRYMQIGITNLINIFNPQFVMIGGMGSELPSEWLEVLEKAGREKALPSASKNFRLIQPNLNINDATLLGSVLLAMDSFSNTILR